MPIPSATASGPYVDHITLGVIWHQRPVIAEAVLIHIPMIGGNKGYCNLPKVVFQFAQGGIWVEAGRGVPYLMTRWLRLSGHIPVLRAIAQLFSRALDEPHCSFDPDLQPHGARTRLLPAPRVKGFLGLRRGGGTLTPFARPVPLIWRLFRRPGRGFLYAHPPGGEPPAGAIDVFAIA